MRCSAAGSRGILGGGVDTGVRGTGAMRGIGRSEESKWWDGDSAHRHRSSTHHAKPAVESHCAWTCLDSNRGVGLAFRLAASRVPWRRVGYAPGGPCGVFFFDFTPDVFAAPTKPQLSIVDYCSALEDACAHAVGFPPSLLRHADRPAGLYSQRLLQHNPQLIRHPYGRETWPPLP